MENTKNIYSLPASLAELKTEVATLQSSPEQLITNEIAFKRSEFLRVMLRLTLGVQKKPTIPRSEEIGDAAFTYEDLQAMSPQDLRELLKYSQSLHALVHAKRSLNGASNTTINTLLAKTGLVQQD